MNSTTKMEKATVRKQHTSLPLKGYKLMTSMYKIQQDYVQFKC